MADPQIIVGRSTGPNHNRTAPILEPLGIVMPTLRFLKDIRQTSPRSPVKNIRPSTPGETVI